MEETLARLNELSSVELLSRESGKFLVDFYEGGH